MSDMSPAETAAASLCWLARFKLTPINGTPGGARIASKVESFWHAKPCRFCAVPMPELLASVEAANRSLAGSDTLRAFNRLPRDARTAKVREAQEEPWYDQLTRVG